MTEKSVQFHYRQQDNIPPILLPAQSNRLRLCLVPRSCQPWSLSPGLWFDCIKGTQSEIPETSSDIGPTSHLTLLCPHHTQGTRPCFPFSSFSFYHSFYRSLSLSLSHLSGLGSLWWLVWAPALFLPFWAITNKWRQLTGQNTFRPVRFISLNPFNWFQLLCVVSLTCQIVLHYYFYNCSIIADFSWQTVSVKYEGWTCSERGRGVTVSCVFIS